jgi:hypothetical protein
VPRTAVAVSSAALRAVVTAPLVRLMVLPAWFSRSCVERCVRTALVEALAALGELLVLRLGLAGEREGGGDGARRHLLRGGAGVEVAQRLLRLDLALAGAADRGADPLDGEVGDADDGVERRRVDLAVAVVAMTCLLAWSPRVAVGFGGQAGVVHGPWRRRSLRRLLRRSLDGGLLGRRSW